MGNLLWHRKDVKIDKKLIIRSWSLVQQFGPPSCSFLVRLWVPGFPAELCLLTLASQCWRLWVAAVISLSLDICHPLGDLEWDLSSLAHPPTVTAGFGDRNHLKSSLSPYLIHSMPLKCRKANHAILMCGV